MYEAVLFRSETIDCYCFMKLLSLQPNCKASYHTFWIMFVAQLEEGSITYREWVPNAKQVFLIGDFNKWENTTPLTSEARIHDLNRLKNVGWIGDADGWEWVWVKTIQDLEYHIIFWEEEDPFEIASYLTVNSGAPVSARALDAGLWSSKIAMESQQSLTSVKSNWVSWHLLASLDPFSNLWEGFFTCRSVRHDQPHWALATSSNIVLLKHIMTLFMTVSSGKPRDGEIWLSAFKHILYNTFNLNIY